MSFDSLGEAYDFYNLYSWELGFGIRYGKGRLNVERTKCMQEIVCGCSGKPEQQNNRSCRCECPAMIRLLRAADNDGSLLNTGQATTIHCLLLTDWVGEGFGEGAYRCVHKGFGEGAYGEQCELEQGVQHSWQLLWFNPECAFHKADAAQSMWPDKSRPG